jgi:hypothetical protein
MKEIRKAPKWQTIIVIFIAIAMPLFFMMVRNNQIQRALNDSAPLSTSSMQSPGQ